MAISTYAELKSAVANWINRDDLTARIPEFINIAGDKLHYGFGTDKLQVEPLRIDAMLQSADLTPDSSGLAAKPTGFLEARRLYVSATPIDTVEYLTPEDFWGRDGASDDGDPVFFTIEGSNFVFAPKGSGDTIKLLYYKRFDELSADGDTNWLIDNYPSIYLSGALAEAYAYIEEPAMAQHWQLQFIQSVLGLQASSDRESRSGSVLRMRPKAVF
jgi:hypothetical protein